MSMGHWRALRPWEKKKKRKEKKRRARENERQGGRVEGPHCSLNQDSA